LKRNGKPSQTQQRRGLPTIAHFLTKTFFDAIIEGKTIDLQTVFLVSRGAERRFQNAIQAS